MTTSATNPARAVQTSEPGPSLRDLARRCKVIHLFGNYYQVKTEVGHLWRVQVAFVGGDFEARCNCPIRRYRDRQCRHELAVQMYKRTSLTRAQFGE